MDKEVKYFIKNNELKIKYHGLKKKILIADRSIPEHVIVHSLAGYIFNKYLNYDVEIVSSLSKHNPLIQIYKSFNIDKFYTVQIKKNF